MAVDSLSDDELLQLKKRARRRLVGAIALMLIALIVLRFVVESRPMPNDKPGKVAIDGLNPPPQNQTTNAFARPKNADAQLNASEPASTAPVPKEANVPLDTQIADSEPVAPPAIMPKPPKVSEPEKPKPGDSSKADRTALQQTAKPEKPASAEEAPKQSEKPQAASGRHIASVVALSDASKAAALRSKIEANGVKAFTETVDVDGKTLTRVKIGPYASAAELEKARAKLALMGL